MQFCFALSLLYAVVVSTCSGQMYGGLTPVQISDPRIQPVLSFLTNLHQAENPGSYVSVLGTRAFMQVVQGFIYYMDYEVIVRGREGEILKTLVCHANVYYWNNYKLDGDKQPSCRGANVGYQPQGYQQQLQPIQYQ